MCPSNIWKWSIHYISLSTHYTAVQIKNCLKSTTAIKVVTMKNMDGATCPSYVYQKWSIHYAILSAAFKPPLHNSINQELFEKHLCSQSSHYEKHKRFPLLKVVITTSLFTINKDEWDTREQGRTLVSPLRIHSTYCSMPKGIS